MRACLGEGAKYAKSFLAENEIHAMQTSVWYHSACSAVEQVHLPSLFLIPFWGRENGSSVTNRNSDAGGVEVMEFGIPNDKVRNSPAGRALHCVSFLATGNRLWRFYGEGDITGSGALIHAVCALREG